jgi:hypothetical protein
MSRIIELRVVRHDRDCLIVTGFYPGGRTRLAPSGCVQQAYYSAVKGKPRPDDLVDLRDHKGAPLAVVPPCQVTRRDWFWSLHEHTHIPLPRFVEHSDA